MPTTLPPGGARDDASQVPASSPLLPDEAALHRVFDEAFPALVAAARAELGAGAASLAPKVAEGAFVHAWEQRARFQTRAGLDAFLRDEVHHGAARALSRRAAAHRLGHHGEEEAHGAPPAAAPVAIGDAPPVDLAESWRHVEATIRDQGPRHAGVRAQAHQHMRHEAAQHVAAIGKSRSWWMPAIGGLVAIVAIVFGMRWVDRAAESSAVERALGAPDARTASSGRGQSAVITLGEGTRVRVAADTRMIIPKDFGERIRAVKLDGAATFDPSTGQPRPLQVRARDVAVVATGTSFSVRAYEGDPDVTVLVHTGTVTVRAGAGEARAIGAGEALAVGADGALRTPEAEQLRAAMGWASNRLVLPARPLGEVLPELRRWFALDVGLADTALRSRPVALDVALDSAKAAIAAVEAQARVKYSYADKGRDLVFRDAAAAAPAATRGGRR